jgi:intracellular multiplication protein IcmS
MALDIQKILIRLTEKHHKIFRYQDKEISLEKAFSPTGCLPILARRANLLSDFLFSRSLDVSYPSDPSALVGERLQVGEGQHTFVLIMLLHDVVEELVVNAGEGDVTIS